MKFLRHLALGCAVVAAAVTGVAHAQQQFVTVLTGGQAGIYYPLGVALANIIGKDVPNVRSTAQVTRASAENLNLLQAGRGELALTLADALSDAWKGNADAGFPNKLDKLRTVSATYNNYVQIVASADSGIRTLADLKGKQVSFGSPSSTSGHLMPRSNLLQAGIDPEKDFRRIAYSGAHDATIASVVSGRVDAAALDITVWRKFVDEKRVDTAEVDVFFTTPPFYNYNWSVHADMPAALREKVTKALLDLDPATPEGKEILQLNRATRYIPTKPENYKGLEAAGRSAGLI